MQISLTELEYCKYQVDYRSGPEEIDAKTLEVLNIFKNAPVPGFRPKKATLNAIKMHYKDQINEAVKRALAESAFHNTLFEKNLKPLGQPEFKALSLLAQSFSCQFTIHTKPTFDLVPYKELEITSSFSKSPEELEKQLLDELLLQHGEVVAFTDDDFVERGNSVIIDYEGFVEGNKVNELSAEAELLTVGSSQVPHFDDNLLGMKTGETREFTITVDPRASKYANQEIKFSVSLTSGSKSTPAKLNLEFAQKTGKESVDQLLTDLKDLAKKKLEHASKLQNLQKVSEKLVETNSIRVPDFLKVVEGRYLAKAANKEWDQISDDEKLSYMALGEKNIKLSLILEKIRENEPEAQLSDHEVLEMIKNSALFKGQDTNQLINELSQTGYLPLLVARTKDEFTLDFVYKHAKVLN